MVQLLKFTLFYDFIKSTKNNICVVSICSICRYIVLIKIIECVLKYLLDLIHVEIKHL